MFEDFLEIYSVVPHEKEPQWEILIPVKEVMSHNPKFHLTGQPVSKYSDCFSLKAVDVPVF